MKQELFAEVRSVGGGTVELIICGAVVSMPATREEEQAFGLVLYREVAVALTFEPVAARGNEPDAHRLGPWCGAQSFDNFSCTRPPGHDGDHVARDATPNVCARWPS